MIYASIAAVLLAAIAVLYILLIAGLPYGEFAMGGQYKTVPNKKKPAYVVSLLFQAVAHCHRFADGVRAAADTAVQRNADCLFCICSILYVGHLYECHFKKQKRARRHDTGLRRHRRMLLDHSTRQRARLKRRRAYDRYARRPDCPVRHELPFVLCVSSGQRTPARACNIKSDNKPAYCVSCKIVNCEKRLSFPSGFCFECDKTCRRLQDLDKRYRTKYHMSMIDNLMYIREKGDGRVSRPRAETLDVSGLRRLCQRPPK